FFYSNPRAPASPLFPYTTLFRSNQGRMGVSVIDPVAMKEVQFIPTGRGAHGLQVSRDTKSLYVSNRLEASISVINFASRSVTARSEEHTSELQSRSDIVCRLLLE